MRTFLRKDDEFNMAKAKKLPSGSWRCLVYDYTDENGKRYYQSFTCDDGSKVGKRIAEKLAADFAAKKEAEQQISQSDHTFISELNSYIELKQDVLSPSTIRGYLNIKKQIEKKYSSFAKMKISKIKTNDIQKVVNNLSKDKSPKTVRNYFGLISATIGINNITAKVTLPKKKKPILYIPTDEDIKLILSATKDSELEIPILLAAFGMMRRGEICGLSMNDLKGNVIHTHHSIVYGKDKKWHLKVPKTEGSDRYFEIPDFVANRIREVGHITTYNPHSVTVSFGRMLKKNGIHHFRFHDLRHYSASIRHALGIPDAYIMADGGWKTDVVLKSVYRHAMDDRRQEMSEKANNHFSELCNTKCNTK